MGAKTVVSKDKDQ